MGVDQLGLPALSRVHRMAVQGVLAGVLRPRVQGAARRRVRRVPGGLPRHIQELGLPDQAADLRRLPHRPVGGDGAGLMCRHLAYLGSPATLRSLLIDPPYSLYRQAWAAPPPPRRSLLIAPPYSLYRQAWAPRRQRHGTVNADGFGIGWSAGADPVPARYRRGEPIWGDPSLPDIARVTRSGAVLAAVRSATPGTAAGPAAAAPFGCGPWLFSHNGAAQGWRDWGEAAFSSWAGSLPDGTPPGPLLSQGQPGPL